LEESVIEPATNQCLGEKSMDSPILKPWVLKKYYGKFAALGTNLGADPTPSFVIGPNGVGSCCFIC
jgi:hypothetical protein